MATMLNTNKISLDKLDATVAEIMNEYSLSMQMNMTYALEKIAKDGLRKMRKSAADTFGNGEYAKGWKMKNEKVTRLGAKYILYNKQPGMPHLLEFGHEKVLWGRRTGERVEGKAHIAPVADEIEKAALAEVEARIINNVFL